MGFIIDAFFKRLSHFWAYLPYNINWRMKNTRKFQGFLEKNPFILADIGARGGSLDELEGLKNNLVYYGFDADKEECDRIAQNPPKGFHKYRIFPYYIGDKEEEIDFHLFRLPGQSSSLKPNIRYKTTFAADYFDIDRTVKVESKKLDTVIADNHLEFPDMIKLDTQGSELNILMSSPECVGNSLLIESEVEFLQMYDGQYLFHDMSKFLYDNGYEILYLNRVFHNRNNYNGEARGQIIWGDALFGKREDQLDTFPIEKIAKYVILLINYGHLDYAHHLTLKYKELETLIPNAKKYFRFYKKNFFSYLRRVIFFQYDKLLYLLIHLRKTNKNNYDHDRDWPIR